MKILLIANYFPPVGGAGAIRWVHLIREISKQHDASVIAPGAEIATIQDEYLQSIANRTCKVHLTKPSYLWTKLKNTSRGFSSTQSKFFAVPDSRAWWIDLAFQLGKTLPKPDVIIATSPPFSAVVAGMKIAKYFKIPLVLDMRDSYMNDPNTGYLPKLIYKFREGLYNEIINFASGIVTVNPLVETEMKIHARYRVPSIYIPNGHDANISPEIDDSPKIISLTGRFFDTLNSPDVLLDVLALDVSNKFKAHFIGPSEGGIEEKLKKLGISSKAEISGPLQYNKVREKLAASHIHFFAMDKRRGNINKIPSKIWDFLSTGLPIVAVASPLSPIAEIIGNRGFITRDKPEEIFLALEKALSIPRIKITPEHSWENRVKDYMSFLDRVINSKSN